MIDIRAWHRELSRVPTTTILVVKTWDRWDDTLKNWQPRVGFGLTADTRGAEHHLLIFGMGGSAWVGWLDGVSFGSFAEIRDAVVYVHVGAWLRAAPCDANCLLCRWR